MLLATTPATDILAVVAFVFGGIGGAAGLVVYFKGHMGQATLELAQTNISQLKERVSELEGENDRCTQRVMHLTEQAGTDRERIQMLEDLATRTDKIKELDTLVRSNHKEVLAQLQTLRGA